MFSSIAKRWTASGPETGGGVDITVVLNAHREGPLLAHSLESARQAAAHAAEAAVSSEIVIVLDRPDATTLEVVEASRRDEGLVRLDAGDLSSARNAGAAAARGRTIAFLDGDDLFGANWLLKGYQALSQAPPDTVLHPQFSILFGEEAACWEHIGMDHPDFRLRHLMFENYFTALAFTTVAVLRRFPYRPISLQSGFGFEDWAWNCETARHGVRHLVVPETLHAIRRRRASLLLESRASRALRIPTPSFLEAAVAWDQKRDVAPGD